MSARQRRRRKTPLCAETRLFSISTARVLSLIVLREQFYFHFIRLLGFPLSLLQRAALWWNISTGCLDTLSQPAILFFYMLLAILSLRSHIFLYYFLRFFMCVVMVMKLNWNSSGEPVPRVEFACCLMLTETRKMFWVRGEKIYYDSAVDDDFFPLLSHFSLLCEQEFE